MRTPHLYIAGPMTGLPEFNYPAFHRVQRELVAAGFIVINPARNRPQVANPQWKDFLKMSVKQVADVDGIAVLPGWQNSTGAQLEVYLANQLGIPHRGWERWRDEGAHPNAAEVAAIVSHYPGTVPA